MRKTTGFRTLMIIAGLAALGLLAGCFETTQEFTLNPDGSGKVVHKSKFQNVDLSGNKRSSEAQVKAAVAEIIQKAKGIEAWSDVSYELLDDGRISFQGTAYFRDLSKLDLPNQTMLEFDWVRNADATGVLTLRQKPAEPAARKPVPAKNLSAEERAKELKESRAKYQQAKPMMAMIVGNMKHEVVFHLPGHPGKSSAFQVEPSGALKLEFEGAKLLAAMESLINDDAWMARNSNSLNPESAPPMDEHMTELMFGAKGPVRATMTGLGEPSFDYEAEVAAAKEAFPAIQQQLGPVAAAIAPPAAGGELKSVKVVGVRLVHETDPSLELRPLDVEASYTLALLVELPGSVHAITDQSGLDTAIASDGSDLLPESDFEKRFSFPKLAANKAAVVIDARMKSPGAGVTGLKELSGHLSYTVADGTKEVDLGFPKLAAGATGKEYGAAIKTLAAKADDGSQQLELDLKLDPDSIKALYLVNGSEKKELSRNGYSGFNDEYTYTYSADTGFPAKAHLVAEVYGNLQTFEATFKLEDLTLLGEPVGTK